MKNLRIALIVILSILIVLLCAGMVYFIQNPYGSRSGILTKEGGKVMNETKVAIDAVDKIEIDYSKSGIDVFIYPSENDEILIKEYFDFNGTESDYAAISEQDGRLVVKGKKLQNTFFSIGNKRGHTEIYLPDKEYKSFFVSTMSGEISGNNDIEIKCSEKVRLSTVSGNIRVKKIYAETIDASTVSGNIEIKKLDGEYNCSTTSGEIYLDKTNDNGKCASVSGNVVIGVAEEMGVALDVSTVSGSIKTFFDENISYNNRRTSAKGVNGNAEEFEIIISTVSGNVKILKAAE